MKDLGGFYSNLFIVPKLNGEVRPVLDLKALNQFLNIQTFRMELINSVITSQRRGEYLASIDIKDAYLYVPIFHLHQKFQFLEFLGWILNMDKSALRPAHVLV